MIEYVIMDKSHVSQVAELERLCFSLPWSEETVASELDNSLALWVVAVDRDKVVGYVGSQAVMGEADMMNLAVFPQYRCKGIGKELVSHLIELLKQRGNYCLTLEVRASNLGAISLYDQLGFTQVGRRPNYYIKPKEDALILKKEWAL